MQPETAARYRRIVEAVTGDPWYFRCVKPCPECPKLEGKTFEWPHKCPTCSGHGVVFREWLPCPACDGQGEHPPRELSGLPTRCLNCEGGRVPDAEGRERIQDACCRRLSEDPIFDVVRQQWWDAIKDSLDVPPIATWAWDNRHNQPWQTAIEQHVREYQADPPDLAANDGAELKRLLREAGWYFVIAWNEYDHADEYNACVIKCPTLTSGIRGDAVATTEAAALLAAVIAAKGEP